MNLYFKNFNLAEEAKNHQIIADKLWLIREKYISLLTDLNRLSINDITNERDKLMNETHEIYINAPKTDSTSYKLALKALKSEEEQFFSEEELDKMLPDHLRKKGSNY